VLRTCSAPFLVDGKRDRGREGARKRLEVQGGGRWKGGEWEREGRGSGHASLAPNIISLWPYACPYLT